MNGWFATKDAIIMREHSYDPDAQFRDGPL